MRWFVLLVGVAFAAPAAISAEAPAAIAAEELAGMRSRGVDFLKTTQAADGSWTSPSQPGISGLVVFALLSSGVPETDPVVAKALAHLETFIQADGGIYHPDTAHKNYETSIALLAFEKANGSGRRQAVLDGAVAFLKGLQWDEAEGAGPDDPAFGGQGYGRSKRPDLSNTSFFLDALVAAGVPKSDPAFERALVFISRCQNRESEHNTTEFSAKVNDGGFYYTPAGGGSSQAGLTPEGGLRSYASMTYAGLKSMIYAGLTPDDPRVEAASQWIRQFYTVEENPGLGQQGVYYYFHTFAKTLDVLGVEQFEDAQGELHDWRAELSSHLKSLQKPNGSWVNANDRWYEGDPNLATAYVLLALQYCERPAAPQAAEPAPAQ